jgi:hypothetical protein
MPTTTPIDLSTTNGILLFLLVAVGIFCAWLIRDSIAAGRERNRFLERQLQIEQDRKGDGDETRRILATMVEGIHRVETILEMQVGLAKRSEEARK